MTFGRTPFRIGIVFTFRRAVITSDDCCRPGWAFRQTFFRYILTFSRTTFLVLRPFFAGCRAVSGEFITDIATQLVTYRRTILSFRIFDTLYRTIVTAVTFYVTAYIWATFAIGIDFAFIGTVLAGLAGYILTDIRAIRTIGVFLAFS